MRKTLFVLAAASLLSIGMASAQTQEGARSSASQASRASRAPEVSQAADPAGGAQSVAQPRAQARPAGTHTVLYKDKTVYDFDADEVTGTMVRPDTELVDGRLGPRFGSLLKPRATFETELLKSVDSL